MTEYQTYSLFISAVSAIATTSACIIALYLSNKGKKHSTRLKVFSAITLNGKVLLRRLIYHHYDRSDLVRVVYLRVRNESEVPFKVCSVEYYLNGRDVFKDDIENKEVGPYGIMRIPIPLSEVIEEAKINKKINVLRFAFSLVYFKINTDYDGKADYSMNFYHIDKWNLAARINRHLQQHLQQ